VGWLLSQYASLKDKPLQGFKFEVKGRIISPHDVHLPVQGFGLCDNDQILAYYMPYNIFIAIKVGSQLMFKWILILHTDTHFSLRVTCLHKKYIQHGSLKTIKVQSKEDTILEEVFMAFAYHSGMPLRSTWFKHNGKVIFLSQAKKLTVCEQGVMPHDYFVAIPQNQYPPCTFKSVESRTAPTASPPRESRTVHPHPAQQRSQWAGVVEDVNSEEYCRKRHSGQLSSVFEEAKRRFDDIRKRLNDMSIQRSEPKDKSRASKPNQVQPIQSENPGLVGLGSKAGRPSFVVNVGETQNLYKTSKHDKLSPSKTNITLDLHGHTKKEALSALNDSLPSWIDTAMNGVYPYVIQVEIVCGKGSQVLSEVVEEWIKCQRQVANAPKGRC
jgi:DNA-nicking Smr family endonuclease